MEDRRPVLGLGGAEHPAKIRRVPDVELSFDPLAVGILGREEGAARCAHVAQNVGEDLPGGLLHERPAGQLEGLKKAQRHQGLVVEHLLEVGEQPLLVRGVAVKPEAHVVPDPAQAHGAEGAVDHLERPGLARARMVPQQEVKPVRGGELGRLLEPPVAGIVAQRQLLVSPVQKPQAGRLVRAEFEGLGQPPGDLLGRGGDFVRLQGPERPHALAEIDQAHASETRALGQVGGGEERLALRGHANAERPAAAAARHLAGRHVNGIDVGPLLPVHLDADEGRVQMAGRLLVLEGFLLHHVAPVAGGIPDGEKDRLVLGFGRGEALLVPGRPVHGVVGMLEEIGVFFVYEAVGGHGSPLHASRARGASGFKGSRGQGFK